MKKITLSLLGALALVAALLTGGTAAGQSVDCTPQEEQYVWAVSSPGDGWTLTGEERWVQGIPDSYSEWEDVGEPVITEDNVPPTDLDYEINRWVLLGETEPEVVTGEVWANWQPNNQQGPQNYEPNWPTDERGTWVTHDSIPPGHAGPDGVYQQGGGNSPWFYRQNAVTDVDYRWQQQQREVILGEENYIEYQWMLPAVTCEEEPPCETKENPVPCDDSTGPEEPEVNEPEVNEPLVNEPLVNDPGEPETDDPVVDKHTVNKPTKTVTVTTYESGRVERKVKRTPNIHSLNQEGM